MANIWYIPLATIDIRHDFYGSQLSSDFQLIPSSDSEKLMANLGMIFRPTSSGALLGLRVTEEPVAGLFRPFFSFEEPFKLSFYLSLKNQHLFHFSNLPLDVGASDSFYLSNRFDKQQGEDLFLSGHSAAGNNVAAEDVVRSVAAVFKYRLSNPGTAVRIFNAFDNSMVWPTASDPQGPGVIINCNLSHVPNGRYRLEEDGNPMQELYKDSRLADQQHFGVVELFSQAPPANFQLTQPLGDGTIAARPRKFLLQFVSRTSIWRYFVVAKTTGLQAAQISLSNGASTPAFNNLPVDPALEAKYGVGKVRVWQSAAAIPFRKIPAEIVNYQLGTRTGRLGFPHLGDAHPEKDGGGNTIVDGAGNPVFFSDKIIHF